MGAARHIAGQWPCTLLAMLAALCFLLPQDARADGCAPPQGLIGVARALSLLPGNATRVPALQAERIGERMEGLRERHILSDLRSARLDRLAGISLDMMAEADRLTRPGASYDARHVRLLLREFDHQTVLACRALEEADGIALPTEAGLYSSGRIDWQAVDRKLRESTLISGIAVLVTMVGVISVLFAIDLAVRWGWTLVYNRRACRVPAVVANVPGLVLTLGRGGFRFLPMEGMTLDLDDGAQVELRVTDVPPLAAVLSRRHETMADFRLDAALSLRAQNEILEQSTISPYYIRKSRGSGENHVAGLAQSASEAEPGAPTTRTEQGA